MHSEESKLQFEQAVRREAERLIAEQQAHFSSQMEQAIHKSLTGVERARKELEEAQAKVHVEYDALQALHAKTEQEGEKLVDAYFENRRKALLEYSITDFLRKLVRDHLEAGRSKQDICRWLQVELKFVEDVEAVFLRVRKLHPKPDADFQNIIGPGAKLRYTSEGRGGTIWFENDQTQFDMWWEFGGGDALALIDIPSPEKWEERTKIPLEKREEVLNFIARQVVEDKTYGESAYLIGNNVITIYR